MAPSQITLTETIQIDPEAAYAPLPMDPYPPGAIIKGFLLMGFVNPYPLYAAVDVVRGRVSEEERKKREEDNFMYRESLRVNLTQALHLPDLTTLLKEETTNSPWNWRLTWNPYVLLTESEQKNIKAFYLSYRTGRVTDRQGRLQIVGRFRAIMAIFSNARDNQTLDTLKPSPRIDPLQISSRPSSSSSSSFKEPLVVVIPIVFVLLAATVVVCHNTRSPTVSVLAGMGGSVVRGAAPDSSIRGRFMV